MQTLGVRIRKMREKLGWTQERLAAACGIPRATLANYEGGRRRPNWTTLQQIAAALQVRVAYLLGEEPAYETGGPPAQSLRESIAETPAIPTLSLTDIDRWFDDRGRRPAEFTPEWIRLPSSWLPPGEFFAVRVADDAMEPRIPRGAWVVIRRQSEASPGDVILAVGPGTLPPRLRRMFPNENGWILQAENPRHPPLRVAGNQLRLLGRAVWKFERIQP